MGIVVGTHFHIGDVADKFEEVYISIYRMMAIPFLILTILYSILRLKGNVSNKPIGWQIAAMIPIMMIITAAVSILVTYGICMLASDTASQGIGTIIASYDKLDANFISINLEAGDTGKTWAQFIIKLTASFIPENIFHALSTTNIGQVVTFMIVFSIAVMKVMPVQTTKFLSVIDAARRPFFLMLEYMLILVPIAVFFHAVHASHAISYENLEVLKLLFGVVVASTLVLCLLAVITIAIVLRESPFRVASDLKAAVLAGILAATEEAALPSIINQAGNKATVQTREIVASLSLAIGRFGMIAVIASVLTYGHIVYDIPMTYWNVLAITVTAILSGALITGLNGPGIFAVALAFAGTTLNMPLEALAILVILLQPLLEMFLIPVSVTLTQVLVATIASDDKNASPIQTAR